MADSSGVTTYRQNILLKPSACQESISDKETLQLSRKLIHTIGDDLKSPQQRVREYANSVVRRAGLTGE